MYKRKKDPWLTAARALYAAANEHPAVLDLDHGRRYETRGRGRTVHGVALRTLGTKAQAHISLVLDVDAVRDRGLTHLVEDIHAHVLTRWKALQPNLSLDLFLDVADLDSRTHPGIWHWLMGRRSIHTRDNR